MIRTHHKKISALVLTLLLLAFALVSNVAAATATATATRITVETPEPAETESASSYDPENPQILRDKFLYAECGVLIEQHTGRVLYNMKGDERMQPASTTKIMTLLVALENGNLSDVVTVGSEIELIPSDSSTVPLLKGEELTLEDLLHVLILRSGNDAAMTIATHIAGSVEAFVELMNQRAEEIGCEDTHFANPHGYEDPEHYTTAMDLARIAREGMQNETFREIVNTQRYTLPKNNVREEDTTYRTTNQFVGRDDNMEYQYEYGTGIKTGYFSAAKHTFVASATKDDIDLIAVVLKTTKEGKWIDATRLMNYGFAVCKTYSVRDLYDADPIVIPIEGTQEGISTSTPDGTLDITETLTLALEADGDSLTLADTEENIQKIQADFSQYCTYEGAQSVTESVQNGAVIGTLTVQVDGYETLRYNLVASRDVSLAAEIEPEGIAHPSWNLVVPVWVLVLVGAVLLVLVAIIVVYIVQGRRYTKHFGGWM